MKSEDKADTIREYTVLGSFLAFLSLLAVMSCKTRQAVTVKEDTKTLITETFHDTIFQTETDSSAYRALLECQNGKVVVKEVQQAFAGKYLKAPKLTIKDNVADCDCEAQAQKLRAQWKAKNKETVTVKEVPVYIEKPLTTWQKTLIALGKFLLMLIIVAIIFGAYKLYKKLKP